VRRSAKASGSNGGASFHGGGLVTDNPNSPHLLAHKIKARMYFGIAANDDMRQPDAKDKLKAAFAAASVPAEIEVYGSLHGWCVPDMPLQNGAPTYNMGGCRACVGQAGRLLQDGSDLNWYERRRAVRQIAGGSGCLA
jgi:dienelactone hydrolase